VLLAGLVWLAGCASSAPESVPRGVLADGVPAPAWPAPPAKARIRFVKSVTGPQDWGIERGFWQRLSDALTGAGQRYFVRPSAVATVNDVLYVADPGARSLWILDRSAGQVLQISSAGNEALMSPVALALRGDGAVFVADTALRKVLLLSAQGKLLKTFASQGVERPAGVAWDEAAHRLYVVDSLRNRISVFDGNGGLIGHLAEGGAASGQLNRPTHIVLDTDGTLLVNDALNFRLQWLSVEGGFLHSFGKAGNGSGDFAATKGIATDGAGHYYAVDSLFDVVQIFDRQGRLLLAFGEHGEGAGQFSLPRGIFISGQDEVYVADAYNRRIQIFKGASATQKEQQP